MRTRIVWILSVLSVSAAVVVHNETVNGFNCSVLVRGSMPVEPGTAFADQGVYIANTLEMWKDWVNEEMGGLSIMFDGVDLRKCAVDLLLDEDYSNPTLVAEIMERYAEEADFLIAPYGSTLTAPAAPIR